MFSFSIYFLEMIFLSDFQILESVIGWWGKEDYFSTPCFFFKGIGVQVNCQTFIVCCVVDYMVFVKLIFKWLLWNH